MRVAIVIVVTVVCSGFASIEAAASVSHVSQPYAVPRHRLSHGASSGGAVNLRTSRFSRNRRVTTFLYRHGGAHGSSICLSMSLSRRLGGGGSSVLTASPSCHSSSDPKFWRLAAAIGLHRPRQEVFAFAFDSAARRIELVKSSGQVRDMTPERLSGGQAKRIGTSNIRFLVFQESPSHCFSTLRVVGRNDRVLGITQLDECQAG
jgi:hypothetical protein